MQIALTNYITHRGKDFLLLALMGVGAACGMIYEYLIAHYASNVLGSYHTVIYGVIGLMVVSMGLGAFYARAIKCPYTGFAWLEAVIAMIGGTTILVIASIHTIAYVLPLELQHSFGLHESITIGGGPVFVLQKITEAIPYLAAFVLGFLIGMEIPLIARIRQDLHAESAEHNTGTVYGADYIGGGVGALIWIVFLLTQPIVISAALTALLNIVLGVIFILHFHQHIRGIKVLLAFKIAIAFCLLSMLSQGESWLNHLNSMLYRDKTVFHHQTLYQNLVVTERVTTNARPPITSLFINGQLQFASSDEIVYHSYLVIPAMQASARHDDILIVGGGDGLAAREAFKLGAKTITLIDLDPEMIQLFQGTHPEAPEWLSNKLVDLNENALNNENIKILTGDAFKVVEQLSDGGDYFDTIIVDLPDPSHPDLNKLYSDYFYSKLGRMLSGDGAITVQSTSPYHTKKAFLSIGKTLSAADFNVNQYHANVPSFGEWGWSLGVKRGLSGKERIIRDSSLYENHEYLNQGQLLGAFQFSNAYFHELSDVPVNQLGDPVVYSFHREGWITDNGIYYTF